MTELGHNTNEYLNYLNNEETGSGSKDAIETVNYIYLFYYLFYLNLKTKEEINNWITHYNSNQWSDCKIISDKGDSTKQLDTNNKVN